MLTRRAFLASTTAFAASPAFPAAPERTPLKIQRRTIEVNGKSASVFGIRQKDGTPGLVTEVGARFRVRVENELAEPSLIHWHGLAPPSPQDGVPEISGPPIQPGGSADYDFPLAFGGTYWMHSHQGFQEQSLLTAPLIIREPGKYADRQEIVVLLSDFSFTPAAEIYASLTKGKGVDHMSHMAHGAPAHGKMHIHANAASMPMAPMKAMPPDLNDVDYDAFLANDRTLDDPEVVQVENGGRVLLRLINGASMSAFHADLGDLDGRLVAVDGQDVTPVTGRLFPMAAGQRLDILLDLPKGATARPILFVLEGERRRTGIILAPGSATIEKVSSMAAAASNALDLDLERRLSALSPLASRPANKTISLDLTGDMQSYVWSINNAVWDQATPPIMLAQGDRVEVAMTNRTMMAHPMHLHGHRFQVVEIDGQRFGGALRDTVLVPPQKRVVIAFDADNPGHWAFHCHLLYHASAGMFATFKYA